MKRWIENLKQIPSWITDGRAVLPKTEDLGNGKNYRPIKCLNTRYKIFTGMVATYMKEHVHRNGILDRNQLGTCSGVLGTVDQLLVDSTTMDAVRGKKRNLAVAFYDYQMAYGMLRHDWVVKVYRWIGIPAKVVTVLKVIMGRWMTRLEWRYESEQMDRNQERVFARR